MKNVGIARIFITGLMFGLLLLSVALSVDGLSPVAYTHNDAVWNETQFNTEAFTNDVVIVVMTGQASLNRLSPEVLETYTIYDFPEVELQEVKSLSTAAEANVREQLLEKQNGLDSSRDTRDTFWDVDIEGFRQILSLTLQTPCRANVMGAIKILEQREDVYAAVPNYIAAPASLSSMRNQTAASKAGLPGAWGITTGSPAITVGIMDTGIDGSHPDLAGRLHPANSNFHGDFTGSSISPLIDSGFHHGGSGHGTHVAGIAGPISAWNVRLASLRVFDTITGGATLQSRLAAINHATLRNIPILNYSGGTPYELAFEQGIKNYNGLFVTSAGNNGIEITPTSNHIGKVSRNILPNLIVVGASNDADMKADSSNWGGCHN